MGVAITIRDVPESVRDELASRAARSGRSLQEYLTRKLVELASLPTPEDVVSRARTRARAVGRTMDVDALLADRDADRP